MQTALVFLRLLHHPRARLLQGAPGGTIEALEFPATLQEIAIRETARRAGEVTILVRESTYGTFRTGDPEVARAVERVERYAAADVGVLLHGETGTGKEHLARLYHAAWRAARRRPDAPFEAVNCGLLTPELAAAALFGHAKGAFTGAVQSQEGHFQRASGGVLLLDELGDLPALTQVQVLRALDQGAVRRVGGSRDEPVNVRVVAATSRDLSALRQDLRFRVAGAVIQLPPLRARADLAALAAALLVQEEERLAALQGRQARAVSLAPDGAERLRAHAWPGNVRELRAALVQALVERGDGGALGADDLAPFLGATAPAATIPLGPDDLSFTAFTRAVRLAFVAAVADRLGHGPAAEALRLGGKQAVGNQVKELRSLAEAPGGEWLQNLVDELGGERRTPGRRPGRERP
jgi:sigma-54 dependent transcriptional regulator, acetoin dehydrogenase operon transcriptional activator AcoR